MPRKKGTPNKVTTETREVLKSILEGQLDQIEVVLATLRAEDPKAYLQVLGKFFALVLPKPVEQTVHFVGPAQPPSWFNEEFTETSKQ